MGQSAQLHARQPASVVMEHAILDALQHVWMAVENRAPLVVKEVAILNAQDVIRSVLVVIIHVSHRARAYVKLLATLDVRKAAIAYANQVVHLVVPIHVVPSVLVNAPVSAIIHALVHVLEIARAHLCRIQYTNQV